MFGQTFLVHAAHVQPHPSLYALALIVWIMYNAVGIKKWGFFTYIRRMSLPEGVPWFMWPILIRWSFVEPSCPATRWRCDSSPTCRRAPTVIVFIVGGTLLVQLGGGYVIAGFASWLISPAIRTRNFVGCLVQAYIFTVLSAQYISSALADEH
ncbi:MAG: hypothetical protein R2742_03905 [Micropruina glycogenica]